MSEGTLEECEVDMRSNLNHWKGRKKYYDKNKIGVILVWLSREFTPKVVPIYKVLL